MSEYTEFTAPNGDTFKIKPLTQGRVREALKILSKQGIIVDSNASNLLTGLEFQAALVKVVLVEWKTADGEVVKNTDKALEDRPKVVSWISNKAKELADNLDKEFDEDLKN